MESVVLDVRGMSCSGCVASVKRLLQALPGVAEVEVSLETGKASIAYEAGRVQPSQFKAAIEDAGFDVVP